MERLTGWDGDRVYVCNLPPFEIEAVAHDLIRAAVERLAAYEDTGLEPETITRAQETLRCFDLIGIKRGNEIVTAEEEGRLLVLPCKVGETIYYLNPFDEIEKGRITMIQQKANGTLKFRVTTTFSHDVTSDAIGETVFLTREAAEAKLKEGTSDGSM